MDWLTLKTFIASLFTGLSLFGASQTLTVDESGYFAIPSLTASEIIVTNASTTLASFDYASSTQWFGGGLSDCDDGVLSKVLWDATTGRFSCGSDTAVGGALTTLNTLVAAVQSFAVGTAGSDINISSLIDTHTFNIPSASATNRGALTSADWTTFNNKAPTANPTFTGLATLANSSTTLASFNYASSTLFYGAGLANCNSENMLTWTDGRFGCESDTSGGGGGIDPFSFVTHFGAITAASTSPFRFTSGLFASSTLHLHKGTTSVPPLRFYQGGTTTTAVDGDIELGPDTFYATTDGGNRGYIPAKHFIRATTTKTFTSNTSEQAIFTNPPTTNGRITLETGLYKFEGLIMISGMSATSGNGAVDILGAGTAVIADWGWQAVGGDAAAAAAGAAVGGSWHQTQQSNTNVVTAATGVGLHVRVRGTFEVTTAGTMIPSFTMTTASASVLQPGSYMMFERIGSTNEWNVGQWD